jgi:glucose/mannose transport system permease protein
MITDSVWRRTTSQVVLYVILILLAVVFLTPVYMVLITSFKHPETINLATSWNLPRRFTGKAT